ncbi:P63C domain-containing protein [Aliarcobacter vitoriensis]|uniref:P63C domain-containing protein n=1 Tax=Aliarcobacter vitoriensis TaxID=2011099 RepID=UPI001C9C5489|nr:P63C domain-containing protein [Aliarcobacter vitoriensis]
MNIKSTHNGILKIGEIDLNVAVLEDGTRIISTSSILKAFGRSQRGWYKNREEKLLSFLEERIPNNGLKQLPIFLDSKALISVMKEELIELLTPIEYYEKDTIKDGFRAEILPKLCELYLNARRENVLNIQQKHLAAQSEILLSSLAMLGITALVDEATGYQYDRERFELQKILNAYISDEILKWQLTFTDEFYREMFRLWKLPFIPKNIKVKPSFIGALTIKYVYDILPNGVVEKIREKTPKTEKGNWKYKFHQSLTPEVGREHLKKQIIETTLIMKMSRTKEEFIKKFNEMYGKNIQLELNFED